MGWYGICQLNKSETNLQLCECKSEKSSKWVDKYTYLIFAHSTFDQSLKNWLSRIFTKKLISSLLWQQTWNPSYVQLANFMVQDCWSKGKNSTLISQEDLKMAELSQVTLPSYLKKRLYCDVSLIRTAGTQPLSRLHWWKWAESCTAYLHCCRGLYLASRSDQRVICDEWKW